MALQGAYVRRKRWEARLLATEIVRVLGEALGPGAPGGATGPTVTGASGRRYQQVSAEQLLSTMGARL